MPKDEKAGNHISSSNKPRRPTSWISSKRERRFWIWALLAIVGIYATLGLGTTLTSRFENETLSAAIFIIGMILAAAAVLALGLKRGAERDRNRGDAGRHTHS